MSSAVVTRLNAILLLYHDQATASAPALLDHVAAFERHSRFLVATVNTDLGFPPALDDLEFAVVVFHYSLFGLRPFALDPQLAAWLDERQTSYRVAIFQDEYRWGTDRFTFIDRYRVQCIYTMLEPPYHEAVYDRCRGVDTIVPSLPGFVSDDLVRAARRLSIPRESRTIDVGYRARSLPVATGRTGQAKAALAARALAVGRGLTLDISTREADRHHGPDWYPFLATCRAALGTESGTSVFDVDGSVERAVTTLLEAEPTLPSLQAHERILRHHEDVIPYRCVAPRHFEAAAFRVCQILIDGRYSDVLQPWRHYVPVEPDFSNLEDALHRALDPVTWRTLTENAYRDVIASGRYAFSRFISQFDEQLLASGVMTDRLSAPADQAEWIQRLNELGDVRSRRFIVFGAGTGGRAAIHELQGLGLAANILGVCDNDPDRWGGALGRWEVRPLEDLPRRPGALVILASQPGRHEIASQLARLGLHPRRDITTMAAIRLRVRSSSGRTSRA